MKLLNKREKRNQNIAIIVLILFFIPIIFIYFAFFIQAFFTENGKFTLANFQFLYEPMQLIQTTIQPIGIPMLNSILFTIFSTLLEVLISLVSGYALSRLTFKGREFILKIILVLRTFPSMLLLVGVLYILIRLGIANSLIGVICVAVAFRLPGSTYIIKNFFDSISKDIENSTLVDGCSRISGFFQVIIHLVKPGIASITIFAFLSSWSNYILFNTLIFTSGTPVLATYLQSLSRSEQMIASYGVFAAMALIYMIPVIIFFVISQKLLMKQDAYSGKGV